MPPTPEYANGVNNGFAALTAASVGYGPTEPTNVVLGFTAGATAGSKIDKVVATITGEIPLCVVNVFIFDGTSYWLIDQYQLPATTLSTTIPFTPAETPYDRLTLSNTEKLYFGLTVAPTSGDVIITTIGGDF